MIHRSEMAAPKKRTKGTNESCIDIFPWLFLFLFLFLICHHVRRNVANMVGMERICLLVLMPFPVES